MITLTILISVNDQNRSSCTYALVFFRSFHLFVFYLFLVCGFMFVNWSGNPKENFLKQPIWQNLLIRIENKPVFDKNHFSLGISKVKDFVTEQHNSLSHTDFIEKYNCQFQPLKYFGLVSALKQVKNSSITQNPTLSIPADSLLTLFLKNAKGTKVVYKKLVRKKTFTPARSQAKWNTTVADWNAAYTLAFKCTKSTTLIIFNIDFCIEYFLQTCFWQRLVSRKTQTAPFDFLLRKISLIFYGTVQTFKRFGQLWLKSWIISTLYLETTRWISQFF